MILPFRIQIAGHLITGLLLAFLLNLALTPAELSVEQKKQPFTTQNNMLAVTVLLHKSAPPEIIGIQALDKGRISVVQPGQYVLRLKDGSEKILYSLSFRAVFLEPGDPPQPTDETRMIFGVPAGKNVRWLEIDGPAGKIGLDLLSQR